MIFVYVSASDWQAPARMLPQVVAIAGLVAAAGFIIFRLMGRIPPLQVSDREPLGAVLIQAAWIGGLIVGVWLIGMVPAIALFGFAYMLIEGKVKPHHALLMLIPFLGGIYFLFHEMLNIPWPQSLLGDMLPELRRFTGRML